MEYQGADKRASAAHEKCSENMIAGFHSIYSLENCALESMRATLESRICGLYM